MSAGPLPVLRQKLRPALRPPDRSAAAPEGRLAVLDRMRGIAMVLMAVDHASLFLDVGRWRGGDVASAPAHFLTRWLAHLCAPTFLVLAGVALALSIARRRRDGESERAIDRHLLARGLFIALLDPLFVSLGAPKVWLQVLWVIGLGVVALVPLRRLPARACLALALGWCVLGEAVAPRTADTLVEGLLFAPYEGARVAIYYPLVPWLAVLLLGFALGRRLERGEIALRAGPLALGGLALVALHVAIRALGGYGNMGLAPPSGSWLAWLDVKKQPPSASFLCLELGLVALCTAALARLEERRPTGRDDPLGVFGETALFFYLAHWTALRLFASASEWKGRVSLGEVWIVAALLLCALYPACRWFRALKRRHPRQVLMRYL